MSSATAKKSSGRRSESTPDLPDAEEIALLLAPVKALSSSPLFLPILQNLQSFTLHPPQVLLLEGGTSAERLSVAHFWASVLNCEHRKEAKGHQVPCFACPVCVRIITHMHRDIFFFNGEESSIKVDDVREVRNILGESPREAKYRLVLFHESQNFVETAANALLKSFEEPHPGTCFVLLAPQRERLLPTLVSRSMVITLPWPLAEVSSTARREEYKEWETALCQFLQTGTGLFDKTSGRGSVTQAMGQGILSLCNHALRECLHLRRQEPIDGQPGLVQTSQGTRYSGLVAFFMPLPPERLRMIDEVLAECQESLLYGINPALVVEWLVTRLYFLVFR